MAAINGGEVRSRKVNRDEEEGILTPTGGASSGSLVDAGPNLSRTRFTRYFACGCCVLFFWILAARIHGSYTAPNKVADYYNQNTWWFMVVGGNNDNIHRTFNDGTAVTDVLAKYLQCPSSGPFLDLGCGVGGPARTLAYTESCFPVIGVTLSSAQVALATKKEAESLVSRGDGGGVFINKVPRVAYFECDFTNSTCLSKTLSASPLLDGQVAVENPLFRGAYAVEAFVHSPSVGAFLDSISSVLGVGGRLVIVDDFLSGTNRDEWTEGRYKAGWQVHTLETVDNIAGAAASRGLKLESNVDLTSRVELWRPRDRALNWFWSMAYFFYGRERGYLGPALSLYLGSLDGGDALQVGLSQGTIQYRVLTFVKQ